MEDRRALVGSRGRRKWAAQRICMIVHVRPILCHFSAVSLPLVWFFPSLINFRVGVLHLFLFFLAVPALWVILSATCILLMRGAVAAAAHYDGLFILCL